MKRFSEIIRKQHLTVKLALLVGTVLFFSANSNAAEQKKIKPRLRMNYTRYEGGNIEVKARAYYKEDRETKPCTGVQIGFYKDEDLNELYKQVPTNEDGEAVLTLSPDELTPFEDTINHYYFFAQIEENEKFRSRDEDLEIWNSNLDVKLIKGDSINKIKAIFNCCDETTAMKPCEKVPLRFYIKRSLAPLPIGGDFIYTDSNGVAETNFPMDIPQDENGNVTVIVRLNEDDLFGTVIFEANTDWGVPAHIEDPVGKGSLIGARNNAPWFMVIGINAILVVIWGFMLYVVVGLVRINRLGKQGV